MKPIYLLLSISLILAACVSPMDDASQGSEPTMTATITLSSTAKITPTPTTPNMSPSPTPEANPIKVKMDLDDWKKIFTGTVKNDLGGDRDLSIILTDEYSQILTDPSEIRSLPFDAPLVILNPNGEIRVWSSPHDAAKLAEDGSIVLLAKGKLPDVLTRYSIKAANLQYQMGNKDIYMTFGNGGWTGFPAGIFLEIENYFIIEQDENGRYYTPVIRKPSNYLLYRNSGSHNQAQPPIEDLEDSIYWIDEILRLGYYAVSPTPEDFTEELGLE